MVVDVFFVLLRVLQNSQRLMEPKYSRTVSDEGCDMFVFWRWSIQKGQEVDFLVL